MDEKELQSVLIKIYLTIPLLLILLSLYLVKRHGAEDLEVALLTWKHWKQISYYFYLINLPVISIWFFVNLFKKTKVNFLALFLFWIFGITSIWFTFVMGGIIADLLYMIIRFMKYKF